MEQGVTREKAEKFFTFFNLQDFTDELMESYSHSMRQKLVITGAFHNPKVVIVDALDPKGARQVKQLFQDLCEKWHNDFYVSSFLRSGRNHVSQSRHYPERKDDSGGNGGTIALPSRTSARRS